LVKILVIVDIHLHIITIKTANCINILINKILSSSVKIL